MFLVAAWFWGCQTGAKKQKSLTEKESGMEKGTYGYDAAFLAAQKMEMIELTDKQSDARVLIAPGLQGRVMTSSADGESGISFGWINHKLIESGVVSNQFNAYGGEERFWLGPEGGPFSIYFKPGDEQAFTQWKVPAALDTEPFEIKSKSDEKAVFTKAFSLVNASGNTMNIGVERSIALLSESQLKQALGTEGLDEMKTVAFETVNTLINKGQSEWNSEHGFLSVWLLCMFNPSEQGVVFIPFKEGDEGSLGKKVTDDYFGKVPGDRLIVRDNMLFFKIDGKYRSKIGISPERALPWCGSYDPANQVLTLLWYSRPDEPSLYVNSKWGEQDDPLKGDVVNSYNDGPADDGTVMGPFYEIESSSPAALLAPGESITHTQRIFHITGGKDKLSLITKKLFGISVDEIGAVFMSTD